MSKPRLVIFGDPNRRFATEAMEEFVGFVKGRAEIVANCFDGSCSAETLGRADFAVVFGGDGTILSAARQLGETAVPVIGVNVGRLGFLAEFAVDELQQLFDRIVTDPSLIEKRMMLSCRMESGCGEANGTDKTNGTGGAGGAGGAGEIFCSTAVNDMVIAAGGPFGMVELKISVDGQSLAGCVGDGLIISTPTGSTAYNLSAGGPILSADISAIVITPLSPHTLSFRPIVISADSVVEIRAVRVNEGTTILLDGQVMHRLGVDDVITVERDNGAFLVVNNPVRTQWDTLAGKLNWAEKPRYRAEG